MLITKGAEQTTFADESAEVRAKDAEIVELRNNTSDMELLREECRQLKQMVIQKNSMSDNGGVVAESKDSNTELQLLEAMLEDRDVLISQKVCCPFHGGVVSEWRGGQAGVGGVGG